MDEVTLILDLLDNVLYLLSDLYVPILAFLLPLFTTGDTKTLNSIAPILVESELLINVDVLT